MHNKDDKQSLFQKINGIARFLLIIAFIAPFFLWAFKLVYNRDISTYDSNWLSFFGSYLGGLLGGVATLIAVIYTIKSNAAEQDRKEENEKQNDLKKSALIVYYDFKFATDNIADFLFKFWELRETNVGSKTYTKLVHDDDFEAYKTCRYILDQFYFDPNWIHTVSKLYVPSLFGIGRIRKIYETYGHLSNINKSLETPNSNTLSNAFMSMNYLIDCKYEENGSFYCELKDDLRRLINYLEDVAFGFDSRLSDSNLVTGIIDDVLERLMKLLTQLNAKETILNPNDSSLEKDVCNILVSVANEHKFDFPDSEHYDLTREIINILIEKEVFREICNDDQIKTMKKLPIVYALRNHGYPPVIGDIYDQVYCRYWDQMEGVLAELEFDKFDFDITNRINSANHIKSSIQKSTFLNHLKSEGKYLVDIPTEAIQQTILDEQDGMENDILVRIKKINGVKKKMKKKLKERLQRLLMK